MFKPSTQSLIKLSLIRFLSALLFFSLSSQLSFSQDFSSAMDSLDRLESLMIDTQSLLDNLKSDNQFLNLMLESLDELYEEQEQLLTEQTKAWKEQETIYNQLLQRYETSERSLKNWKKYSPIVVLVSTLLGSAIGIGIGVTIAK